MIYNIISFVGIFGLCGVAWVFSELGPLQRNKPDKGLFGWIPWRVIIWGVGLQLGLGFLVFIFPPTRTFLEWFTSLLDGVFFAADAGARFVFGPNMVPATPPTPATTVNLGYIFAVRALPAVIFFSGLMALLENLGLIQPVVNFFAVLFYRTMRLSGAEALSGAANIFVGIEAAIVVKPYLPSMTRSELNAILACCFGTAASSTLAIYVSFLRPVFPNILGHLVSASVIAIPACFVLSKILVPEISTPVTAGGIPQEEKPTKHIPSDDDSYDIDVKAEDDDDDEELAAVGTEVMKKMSPLDAAILGALDGVKMAVSIAAVLILIVGGVSLINQIFGALANLDKSGVPIITEVGRFFRVFTLANIAGVLFYPLTLLTGVPFNESFQDSVLIGRRLLETAIPPYRDLAEAAKQGLSPRSVLIVSYALSGFAHLASVGIFVGGTSALIPERRKDISELGWKSLFVGTLATMMIACIAGVFDTGDPSILGEKTAPAPVTAPASPAASPSPVAPASPAASPSPVAPASPAASPSPVAPASPAASPSPVAPASPAASPSPVAPASPAAPPSPAQSPRG